MGREKIVIDNYILALCITENTRDEITQKEYDTLTKFLRNKPTAPDGYYYMLRADNLEWELVQNPIEEEPTDE